MEKIYTRMRMEADGTGTRQTTSRVHVLADSGVKELAVLTFTYTSSNQQVDIGYVRVIKPDGTVVVTPDYNVQDMPADVTRTAPMYSDIHEKHVAVKGLGVGDILESQVTIRTLKPEVPGQFWLEYTFEKNLIALDEQLDLDLPADKTVTVASSDLQPTVTTAAGRKLYHWASSNLARPDPDAPPKSTKHVKPSVQVTTFTSWAQVGDWYQSLQQSSLSVTPAIQAKADALTKGLTTNEDKLRAIFNDVALHTHYVGLDFGIGRYQPHPADDVLSNEYGDCKDKHTLLATELKAVGIQAWPVLISSSRELDPATPSPAQFNHVITLVPLGGKLLWMDSTEEVAPIGVLVAILRDKQALAIPSDKPAYLERTPVNLPFPMSARVQVEGKLSDKGQFTGHISQTFDGDVGMFFRSAFRQVPQSQWKELLQRVANAQTFAGEVSNPQVSEVEQISQPFQFSFDYTREKYYQWDDNETSHWIGPPMPPIGWELAPGVKEKMPADEPEIGAIGEAVYHSSLQLPVGWSMIPPTQTDLKFDWAEYHSTYSFKGGTYTAERRLQVKMSKVPLDQWEKYLDFRRGIYMDENQMTSIFNSTVTSTIMSPFTSAVTHDWQQIVAAAGLMPIIQNGVPAALANDQKEQLRDAILPLHDAMTILQANPLASPEQLAKAVDLSSKGVSDLDARTLTLPPDDARSLYWTQVLAYAWCMRGWSALEIGDLPAAENYLRAAWRLSQDRMSGYLLARVLEANGNKTDAAHQYELAHATSVENSFGGFLFSDGKLKDRILENYRKLTGKEMTSTALNHGNYNGSLLAELDKGREIRGYVKSGNLNGQALFTVAYEEGKPIKAFYLEGDESLARITATLENHSFPVDLPAGSKALLLREVRLVCAPFGGCDAYMLLPGSIQIPTNYTPHLKTRPDTPPDSKPVQVEVRH